MVISCDPVGVNKRNIASVSEKSNTNYAIGLRFKYLSVLQVIAGSIHNVDTALSEERRLQITGLGMYRVSY